MSWHGYFWRGHVLNAVDMCVFAFKNAYKVITTFSDLFASLTFWKVRQEKRSSLVFPCFFNVLKSLTSQCVLCWEIRTRSSFWPDLRHCIRALLKLLPPLLQRKRRSSEPTSVENKLEAEFRELAKLECQGLENETCTRDLSSYTAS